MRRKYLIKESVRPEIPLDYLKSTLDGLGRVRTGSDSADRPALPIGITVTVGTVDGWADFTLSPRGADLGCKDSLGGAR